MDIERYDPWEEFNQLQEEIRRLFDGFFDKLPHAVKHVSFAPTIDLYESDGTLIVRVELPGVVEDDVDISVSETSIVLRGERERPANVTGRGYYRQECAYGYFERRIELPHPVVPREFSAHYEEGVLEVRIPLAKDERE